jgi:inner membrane protein
VDNLTHGLVGVLLAETCLQVRARRAADGGSVSPRLRFETYSLAVIGNNLPDTDIGYARLVGGQTFGYLLQHRGFTHTVPVALLIGVAMLAVVFALRRRARARANPGEAGLLVGVALASPLLHIAMDFANNYGVHPFWPLDDRWFYGDTLFIVEPALWIAIVAPLVFSMSSRWVRAALGTFLAVSLVALFVAPVVARVAAVALTVITVLVLLVARRASPAKRAVLASSLFFATLAVFATCSHLARARAVAALEEELPNARTVDVAVTPMPADPACWNVLWLGEDGDDYVLRLGHVALAAGCVFGAEPDTTAPMTALPKSGTFRSEYRRPLGELTGLASRRCEVAALLQFARAPYVTAPLADGTRIAGDLRYDRKPELDFADIRLAASLDPAGCPPNLPPWIPPRRDLFPPLSPPLSPPPAR